MSLPNIPNITPYISLDRCEVVNLLLSSVAMEEISLSHILNAEGEKIQKFLATCSKPSACELIEINKSVEQMLRNIIKSQFLLHNKLEDILQFDTCNCCNKCNCSKCRKY